MREGFVLVRNPVNPKQVSRVSLSSDVLDCVVFWTKDASPALGWLDQIKTPYCFQYAVNPYGNDLEPYVPSKREKGIDTFIRLSEKIGPKRVAWRYNPVVVNSKYDEAYHINYFEKLANRLSSHAGRCVVSFLDMYPKIEREMRAFGINESTAEQKLRLMHSFSEIAKSYDIPLFSCSESGDYAGFGILPGGCIEKSMVEDAVGFKFEATKDTGQRAECRCIESIDIGAYDTCLHGCLYCYANRSNDIVRGKAKGYDPASPLLCSTLREEDHITKRKVSPLVRREPTLFD